MPVASRVPAPSPPSPVGWRSANCCTVPHAGCWAPHFAPPSFSGRCLSVCLQVPGAFELPSAALEAAKAGPDAVAAVICIGVLIKGSTMHFEYISDAVSHGIMRVGLDTGVPTIFGVLTCLTDDQARERAGIAIGEGECPRRPCGLVLWRGGRAKRCCPLAPNRLCQRWMPMLGRGFAGGPGHNHGIDWARTAGRMALLPEETAKALGAATASA